MPSKYKAEWRPMELNVEFWREVLLGRRITAVVFDEQKMKAITLDNGEILYLQSEDGKATIAIQDHHP